MSKPKVVIIGPKSSTGGIATAMRAQLSSNLKQEYRLRAFDNSKRTPAQREMIHGVLSQLQLMWELLRLLNKERPDIVHIHTCSGMTFYRSAVDILITRLFNSRVVVQIHGGRFEQFVQSASGLSRRMIVGTLRSVDRVVVLSESWLKRFSAIDNRISLQVVGNGVEMPPRAKRWSRRVTREVVFVGALTAAKGVDDLIEAVRGLGKKWRSCLRVHVVGPDPQQRHDELQTLLEEYGLADVFEFHGTLSKNDVDGLLKRADLFVIPSHSEALPIALLEAMSWGLPAIATRVGAVPEMIKHRSDGLLIDAGNVKQLTSALRKLLTDVDFARALGKSARLRVRNQYTTSHVAEALGVVYQAEVDSER